MEPFTSAFTIDVRRLRVLREVRERGTIGATAKALGLTPSAISQQLSALGREIGVPLLAPQGRRVRLTQQAELLLDHATAIDAQLERARADLAAFEEGAVGRVSIGAFATAISGLIAPALERLRRERPRLRLSIREVGPDCHSLLDRGELDLGVTVDHRGGRARGDARYARWELLDDRLVVALPRDHRLARAREVDLLAIAKEPWILGGHYGPCGEAVLAACSAAGFTPDVVHSVDDWSAGLRLVAAGCGVGLAPELALASGPPPGVVIRPPAGSLHPSRHVYVAARAGAERSPNLLPVVEALLAVARERAGAPPAARGRPPRTRTRRRLRSPG